MQQSVTALFKKRMDRQEFLRTLLLIILTFIGLGIVAKNIGNTRTTSGSAATPKQDSFYGKNQN